jgi:hypothetical protein
MKASAAYDRRFDEMMQWRNRAVKAIRRKLNAHRIEAAGGEIAVLERKIAAAEHMHDLMKRGNKIIRSKKLSDDEKIVKMVEIGISDDNTRKVLKPDFAGVVGFTGWQLSNNLANIKRMKARLVEMRECDTTPTSETAFSGGTIIDNAEADRVQIAFDEKPDGATRAMLKSAGWRWAPSVGVWQRKRTAAAMGSAMLIVGGGDRC